MAAPRSPPLACAPSGPSLRVGAPLGAGVAPGSSGRCQPWMLSARSVSAAFLPSSVNASKRHSLRFPAGQPDIRVLPVELQVAEMPVGVVTLKNRTLGPVAQLFIDCAREVAKPLAKRK